MHHAGAAALSLSFLGVPGQTGSSAALKAVSQGPELGRRRGEQGWGLWVGGSAEA